MECLVRILLLFLPTLGPPVHAQQFRGKNEVFFVNLEEGFFGCQVNESSEFLQIFKISNLCDGKSDCYLGSDENQKELKCSSKYFCFVYTYPNNSKICNQMQLSEVLSLKFTK